MHDSLKTNDLNDTIAVTCWSIALSENMNRTNRSGVITMFCAIRDQYF